MLFYQYLPQFCCNNSIKNEESKAENNRQHSDFIHITNHVYDSENVHINGGSDDVHYCVIIFVYTRNTTRGICGSF